MRLIDADKLKQELEVNGLGYQYYMLDNAPTVDAEPVRHGKFVGTEYDGYADGYPVYYEWECSQCGCVFEDEEPTYKYCPNCGAKMDGERK